MTRFATPVLIVALLALAACEMPRGSRPTEGQMSGISGLEAYDMEVLWIVLMREIEGSGFQIDRDKTSMNTGVFESRWRMELAPFRYEGRRKRIVGVARENPPGSQRFDLRLTVWTQRNADIEDPMDPSQAIWQDVEPDTGIVDDLLWRVRKHFPDFRGGAEGGEGPTGE
jgi:hypothetical protein